MLLGRLRILGKLSLLVLVPLLGVVALAGYVVDDRIRTARAAQDTAAVIELAAETGATLQELQEERLLSVGYLFYRVSAAELTAQSAVVDDRLERLAARPGLPEPVRAAVGASWRLATVRATVLDRGLAANTIVREFNAVVTPIRESLGLRANADLTTSAGRQIFALDQSLRNDDELSQAVTYLVAAAITRSGVFIDLFYPLLINLQADVARGAGVFTPEQYKLYLAAQDAITARTGPTFLTRAPIDPEGAIALLPTDTLFTAMRSVSVLGGFVQQKVVADADAAVTAQRDSALRTAGLVGGATLLLTLVVFALSALTAGKVARPLRRLTASADRVAREAEGELERVADDESESYRPMRLDTVDVASRDEIGDLARAFDRVQNTAARLVERQVVGRRNIAEMFGHVGRRTQNLVGRQLALIDNLERDETDTARLGDLYRLDHLSSRLRRNASSLVVLSGGAGRNEHMTPLPLSDVVRLALGEIEDYTRVDVDVPEEVVVLPNLVADLTLMLAELMENATSFSPPHTRVTVTATVLGGGARLAVIDRGLGLPPERIAEENARLTRRERLDLAPTEVLGLFVVGRLARRHGIEVTLTDTAEGGVTAWVDLRPAHLVARTEPTARAAVTATDVAPLITGTVARSAPGSTLPFDAAVLNRATRTLQAARSWNAFAPVHDDARALEPAPADRGARALPPAPAAEPPAELPSAPAHLVPVPPAARTAPEPPPEDTAPYRPGPDRVAPYRPEHDGAGPYRPRSLDDRWPPPRQRTAEPVTGPPGPVVHPAGGPRPLRRRVPGTQLPAGTAPHLVPSPPTADDARAARASVEAFEAGVSRAHRDARPADHPHPAPAGPPPPGAGDRVTPAPDPAPAGPGDPLPRRTPAPADRPPLTRRVPGATLPDRRPAPAAAAPVVADGPLDPDAARALVEQFEHGVALALDETRTRHEGQPR